MKLTDMKLIVNGDEVVIKDSATVEDLIIHLSLTEKRLAVEVNQNIISKSRHSETLLSSNDTIEIIHAIGGG